MKKMTLLLLSMFTISLSSMIDDSEERNKILNQIARLSLKSYNSNLSTNIMNDIKITFDKSKNKKSIVNNNITQSDNDETKSIFEYIFCVSDFENFLELFLLFLPYIDNLQEKINVQIHKMFNKFTNTNENLNKIALLIFMGADCHVEEINVETTNKKQTKQSSINVGKRKPILKLNTNYFWALIHKINYFCQQESIIESLKNIDKSDEELKSEQKQIAKLCEYKKQKIEFRRYIPERPTHCLVW